MSFKTKVKFVRDLWQASKIEKERSGKGRIRIFNDAVKCRKDYGTGVTNYMTYGFSLLPEEVRSHYLTDQSDLSVSKLMNNADFNDKWYACVRLKPYFKRDTVHLVESSPEEIDGFLAAHEEFFAKVPDSSGGKGVLHITPERKTEGYLKRLRQDGYTLLEESIVQHPELDRINPNCINTMRIVTCLNPAGELHFFPIILRVGASDLSVDNISSGGLYTLLTPDGKIGLEGYYQENLYAIHNNAWVQKNHPLTGLNPLGFQIPYFQETLDMVTEMALACPDLVMPGWDIAITPDGPDLVEVNNYPGIDINQNYYFTKILGLPHVGAKDVIEKHLGGTFTNDRSYTYIPAK